MIRDRRRVAAQFEGARVERLCHQGLRAHEEQASEIRPGRIGCEDRAGVVRDQPLARGVAKRSDEDAIVRSASN